MAVNKYITNVCQLSNGKACCKYLTVGLQGFECGKVLPTAKRVIDQMSQDRDWTAQGDNCEGQEDLQRATLTIQ